MLSKSANLDDFIDEVYPNISSFINDSNYAIERTILAAKNEDVDQINDKVLHKLNGNEVIYKSADSIINCNSKFNAQNLYPVEYLNS